ncbi:MAG: substrate-binding domain-containing protein [Oscillospiraceae bacterium]|nr:substrate-binding domain-containing protein [Oscillospiraceae bacterium]
MKKVLALILALAMCFSLVACGGGEKKDDESAGSPVPSQSASQQPTESKPAEEKPSESKPAEEAKPDTPASIAEAWIAKGEGQEFNVLYIPSWAASEYFVNSYNVWKEQFEARGWNLDMQGPLDYTGAAQLGTLEAALLSEQYDAIVLYPITPDPFEAALDEMWETYQVPIIVWGFDESLGGGHYFSTIDNSYATFGHLMAELAIEYVEENMDYFKSEYLDQGKKIPFAVSGSAANAAPNVRTLTAMEDLLADGRFEMVVHFENVDEAKAQEYGETLALNYPETEILICYNDVHAVGFDTAFKTVGGVKDTLRMFGCDGTQAAISLMVEEGEDGYIGGTVCSSLVSDGEYLMDIVQGAIAAAQEGEIVDELVSGINETFTQSFDKISWKNAEEFLMK